MALVTGEIEMLEGAGGRFPLRLLIIIHDRLQAFHRLADDVIMGKLVQIIR